MDDNILIDKFLAGDQGGFEMLVKKYQTEVVNIVYSLIGRRHDAEDIAQEVFIKVYHKLASFKRNSQFYTWLYRITMNTTYTYLRRNKRYIPLEDVEKTQAPHADPSQAPQEREQNAIVDRAIEELPLKLRSVLVLKDIEGLSYKEIAAVLDCRMGTVESRLFRAREMLKKRLHPILKEQEDGLR